MFRKRGGIMNVMKSYISLDTIKFIYLAPLAVIGSVALWALARNKHTENINRDKYDDEGNRYK